MTEPDIRCTADDGTSDSLTPPFSKSVVANVGKYLRNFIRKHFPRKHKFSKIFNMTTLKLSYSCMHNMKSIINAHNRKITTTSNATMNNKSCNCNEKNNCPLRGNCLAVNSLYEGTVTSTIPGYKAKVYAGACEPHFQISI